MNFHRNFVFMTLALALIACAGEAEPIEAPGNITKWQVKGQDKAVGRLVIRAEDDFVIGYLQVDEMDEEQRFRVHYSGLHFSSCSDPILSMTDRRNLVALRKGERSKTIIGDKVYKNLGVQDVDINGKIRNVEVFQSSDFETYFDPKLKYPIAEKGLVEDWDYFVYHVGVERDQPIGPALLDYVNENCNIGPLKKP